MTRLLRIVVLLAIAIGLVACPAVRRPEVPSPATTVPTRPARDYSGARVFQVVSAESLVRILAYRGGTLASSGHNHVIASHDLAGKVYVHQEFARSGFDLTMPVASLEVDPPALRQEEGADFASVPSASAKDGTRKNMLSPALLDGERFPDVTLAATAVEGTRESPVVTALIGVGDRQYEIKIPLAIRYDGPRLVATGEFTVKQTDLGLTPFSALMGALQVRDELKVKFNVVAQE